MSLLNSAIKTVKHIGNKGYYYVSLVHEKRKIKDSRRQKILGQNR